MTKIKKTSKNNKQRNSFLRFSAVAIQMGVIIGLGSWGGVKLDEKFDKNPLFTIVFSLLSVGIALYLVIKEVIKMGKENG